jgi:hypothetical protein
MTAQSHRIFASHSHLDNDFGTRFAQDLRRALKDESAVWYDVLGGLHGGETWWEKIVEELTARDVFIVVLSPDSMNSHWVRREITMAFNENKYVLPVLYRSCSIRADLKILQIISFLAPKPYNQAFGEVLFALGLSAGTPVEPREQASALGDPAAALLGQLQAAFDVHDWPDAIRKADYIIKHIRGSASALVYRLQGVALLEEGEEQQAQEVFETALALVSKRELRLTLLSDSTALLAKQGQWTKVQQRAREALALCPMIQAGWPPSSKRKASWQNGLLSPSHRPSRYPSGINSQSLLLCRGRRLKRNGLMRAKTSSNPSAMRKHLLLVSRLFAWIPTMPLPTSIKAWPSTNSSAMRKPSPLTTRPSASIPLMLKSTLPKAGPLSDLGSKKKLNKPRKSKTT